MKGLTFLQDPGGIVVEELSVELRTICRVMPVRPEESMNIFIMTSASFITGTKLSLVKRLFLMGCSKKDDYSQFLTGDAGFCFVHK